MHLAMGAIITRRTSRAIIAESFSERLVVPINFSLSNDEKHATAAAMLVRKMAKAWALRHLNTRELINAPQCGQWVGGSMPKDDGFAFSYVGETNRTSGLEPRGFVQNCENDFAK